jgi:Flp pilus assembly protein TadD
LQADVLEPAEAIALLRHRPPAVQGILISALEHWLILAHQEQAPEIWWLERVLATADSDPWRQCVRAARCRRDRPALEHLAQEVDAASQPPEALVILAQVLCQRDAQPSAVALLRRAQEAWPGDFWINLHLGRDLQQGRSPQYGEAVRFLTVAAALRPESAGVRLNLGNALQRDGRPDEAAGAFRRAIALKHDYAAAYHNLGQILVAQGRFDQAAATWRKETELTPDCAEAHYCLGIALMNQGRLEQAEGAYRRAIALKADYAEAHCNLGATLWKQRDFPRALIALRRGHELGSRRADWPYPSAQWVQDCQRLVDEAQQDVDKIK